jgi:primosomal protein N' (replication factor Y)
MTPYANLALLGPPFAILTYRLPDSPRVAWTPGLRAVVPVGRSLRAAVVVELDVRAPEGIGIKDAFWPLEREPILDAGYLDMARQLALRQSDSLSRILGSLLPPGLRSARAMLRPERPGLGLAALSLAALARAEAATRELAAELFERGQAEIGRPDQAREPLYLCACDPPWPVRPAARRQLDILELLHDRGRQSRRAIAERLGPSSGDALGRLVALGLVAVERETQPEPRQGHAPPLTRPELEFNPDQAGVVAALDAALCGDKGQAALLFGVTGSGKTRVYLECAARCLAAGRPALLLAPEVALALKLAREAAEALPGAPLVLYHGSLPQAAKETIFLEAARPGPPALYVGTRSALFLPVRRPGLIVLDEEHDASFKQDERLVYQAKEIAHFRTERDGGLLLLGSATPDVKTYQAARDGHAPLYVLDKRVGQASLPDIEFVSLLPDGAPDTKRIAPGGDPKRPLTPRAMELLRQTVAEGEQAIIMLNRRGYAPVMYCLSCEKPAKCPHCDLGLTYHKRRERLVCHYCGAATPFPAACAHCGGNRFLPMGLGSELLEERLADLLPPGTKVLRLDRDSARRTARMEEILADFAARKAAVLTGTQMLSKGHHFPAVTLVIAADGDLGLSLPDYRASERTFQMLVQISGRAGRGDKPGRVLIQTRNPANPFWDFVKNADYEGFFAYELEKRRRYGYPPFVKLGLIRLSHPLGWEEGGALLGKLSEAIRQAGQRTNARILGPAPAPLPLIAGRLRHHCLIKASDWPAVRDVFAVAQRLAQPHQKMRISLDLDPVDMM